MNEHPHPPSVEPRVLQSIKPTKPVPTSGVIRVRARYCECDPMGVVHHAAYIPWLEMARTELVRDAGVSYAQLEAAGVYLVIVKLDVAYKRPAYYDDVLEIRTRVVGPGSRVKIRHEYELVRAMDDGAGSGIGTPASSNPANLAQVRTVGETILAASSMLACVDQTGRPAALPEWLCVVAP